MQIRKRNVFSTVLFDISNIRAIPLYVLKSLINALSKQCLQEQLIIEIAAHHKFNQFRRFFFYWMIENFTDRWDSYLAIVSMVHTQDFCCINRFDNTILSIYEDLSLIESFLSARSRLKIQRYDIAFYKFFIIIFGERCSMISVFFSHTQTSSVHQVVFHLQSCFLCVHNASDLSNKCYARTHLKFSNAFKLYRKKSGEFL